MGVRGRPRARAAQLGAHRARAGRAASRPARSWAGPASGRWSCTPATWAPSRAWRTSWPPRPRPTAAARPCSSSSSATATSARRCASRRWASSGSPSSTRWTSTTYPLVLAAADALLRQRASGHGGDVAAEQAHVLLRRPVVPCSPRARPGGWTASVLDDSGAAVRVAAGRRRRPRGRRAVAGGRSRRVRPAGRRGAGLRGPALRRGSGADPLRRRRPGAAASDRTADRPPTTRTRAAAPHRRRAIHPGAPRDHRAGTHHLPHQAGAAVRRSSRPTTSASWAPAGSGSRWDCP